MTGASALSSEMRPEPGKTYHRPAEVYDIPLAIASALGCSTLISTPLRPNLSNHSRAFGSLSSLTTAGVVYRCSAVFRSGVSESKGPASRMRCFIRGFEGPASVSRPMSEWDSGEGCEVFDRPLELIASGAVDWRVVEGAVARSAGVAADVCAAALYESTILQ